MFDKFTDRAHKVMGVARQEAERLKHDCIDTEHMLLALAREGTGVAANVLENLGLDLDHVKLEVEKRLKKGPNVVTLEHMPFPPSGKRALEFAYEETRAMGQDWVGTGHLLLGLFREGDGTAARVLAHLGLKYDKVKKEIIDVIGPGPPPEES